MKLELKHLAAYLPYELMCIIDHKHIDNYTGKLTSLRNYGYIVVSQHRSWRDASFWRVKPILRPLSDLTEEIEVGGERFVPIVESFNQFFIIENPKTVCHNDFWCVDSFRNELRTRYSITKNPNSCAISFVSSSDGLGGFGNIPYQYELFQMLLSWHFDIFGLIEKGLAIDINTLNQ